MDVPINALRPTLIRALETIEVLKESRKKDAEKIKLAIKELKEGARREQAQKVEVERLLDVEKTLKELLDELKGTEGKHKKMVDDQKLLTVKIQEIEGENNGLKVSFLELKKHYEALNEENKSLKLKLAAEEHDAVANALQGIKSKQIESEQRNEKLVQTLTDLQYKHNALVQFVEHVHVAREKEIAEQEKEAQERQDEVISFLSNAIKLSPSSIKKNGGPSPLTSSPTLEQQSPQNRQQSSPPPAPESSSRKSNKTTPKSNGYESQTPKQKGTPSYLKLATTDANIFNSSPSISGNNTLALDFTVRPDPEYGMCCKLEEGYNIVAFRRLPNGDPSPMQFVGIRKGDRIIEINNVKVNPDTPVRQVMAHLKGQKIIHLKIERTIGPMTPVHNNSKKLNQSNNAATPVVTPSGKDGVNEHSLFINSLTERWQRSSSTY